MCGIIGYSGPREAAPVLLDSLQRLEYRGYDSAGIAVLDDDGGATVVAKSNLKVADLIQQMEAAGMPRGHTGIGHTRWATHGRPTVSNAHPHRDCTGRIHIIHNGIIENYRELRVELTAAGHEFTSDTDTEVVPHLIEQYYEGDLAGAVRAALQRIRGAYALVAVSADEPSRIVGARLNAPLVIGLGDGEVFVSSDITALIPYTKRVVPLGEGQVASVSPESVEVTTLDGTALEPRVIAVTWEAEQAQKNGFPHFMLKEIHEQPDALRSALRGRIDDDGLVDLPDILLDEVYLRALDQVTIVACGSAWIAGLVTRTAIETLARVRCDVQPSSEFRYSNPLLDEHTLVVAISQSGETADTMAAVREARRQGATVIAVTNVVGSALSMEADGVIYMQSGPEISVAATKTMLNQIACGMLLALRLGQARGVLDDEEHRRLATALTESPALVERALLLEPQLAEMAQRYAHTRSAMFIGRGINFPVALEGAMKLKEISYIHAEGYAAGELKHGPIALLDPDVPVVALATRSRTLPKIVSNIQEVSSRDAPVIAVVTEGENPFDAGFVRDLVEVPLIEELISPLVNIVPLQLFAYHVAVERGCDVDQPRNLAKSVTVE
ncbi:MAG: glutamine--fructose-6-phosphate transaminase (isomerizing) [Candidatus Dormibacteraeota bacterium]|uniref:Glutamine--fructose-6-phosphate aminotransferase [isomerizing] n=1 Tax=Candidatus Aeolococcus gillhamiae TaxID=3127015 RepID=A0A934N5L6_9BACT|nr:glutamine--fructose-6-phosphate transaminase (isomerizing) [Candidatus Dormibacteraeota bacterium]